MNASAINENSINTCCPACHTGFNVTTGQLKIADGLVRCGGCLHVFDAQQFITPHSSSQKSEYADDAAEKKPTEVKSAELIIEKPPTAALKAAASDSEFSRLKPTPKPTPQQDVLLTIPESHIELFEAPTTEHPLTRYISYICITALTFLCAAQILWFQQHQWLQHDFLRPIYQALYSVTEQSLPTRKLPDLIISKQFIIQPHEELADAIRISVLLENNANFAQPFPALQLLFTDLKGRTIAQRTLPSHEYINTSLFPNQLMPSKQPVQIQLDMMAPGRRAVGYQLNLISD